MGVIDNVVDNSSRSRRDRRDTRQPTVAAGGDLGPLFDDRLELD
jgi:hypothetical protein